MLCIYIHIVSCKDLEQIYWMSAGKKSMGKALIGAGKGQHTVLVFLHILCARKVDSTKYFVPLFPPFYQKGRMLCQAEHQMVTIAAAFFWVRLFPSVQSQSSNSALFFFML